MNQVKENNLIIILLMILSSCIIQKETTISNDEFDNFMREQALYNGVNSKIEDYQNFKRLYFTSITKDFCDNQTVKLFSNVKEITISFYEKDSLEISKCLCEIYKAKRDITYFWIEGIEALPKEISKFKYLEGLNIKASILPKELIDLDKLRSITFVPYSNININQCTDILMRCKITDLNLSYNNLNHIPIKLIKEHPTLKNVNISMNNFDELSCDVFPTKSVEYLKVNHLLDTIKVPSCFNNSELRIR